MSTQPQNSMEQAAVDNWKNFFRAAFFYRVAVYDPSETTLHPYDPFGLKEFLDENQNIWEESRWDDICAAFLVGQGIPVTRAIDLAHDLHYNWSCTEGLP